MNINMTLNLNSNIGCIVDTDRQFATESKFKFPDCKSVEFETEVSAWNHGLKLEFEPELEVHFEPAHEL